MWAWVRSCKWRKMGRSSKGLFMARKAASTRVSAPDLIGRQILAVGLHHITAIQFFRDRFLVHILLPGEALALGIILDPVVAGHSRVALLEPAHCLVDLLGSF